MTKKAAKNPIEITSEQLLNELSENKDRVGALETVAGIANQEHLVKFFAEVLTTPQRKQIMAACKEPKTIAELVLLLDLRSPQALNHHLKPLREGLLHEVHTEGNLRFEWSLLFKRIPSKKRDALLGQGK